MRSGEIQLKCGLLALGLLVGCPGMAMADVKFNFNTIDVPLCPLLPNALCPRTAVNGNGNNAIVGEFDDTAGNTHGFVLRGGAYTPIDVPGAISGCSIPAHPAPCYTTVNGINESGRLVGIYQDQAGQFHAFFFSCTAGDLSACSGNSFTTLDPAGAIYSQGGFINSQGQVVGSYITSDQKWHGFIWQSGSFISPINVPNDHPELGTVLFGINDRGQIVGSYVDMGPPPQPRTTAFVMAFSGILREISRSSTRSSIRQPA